MSTQASYTPEEWRTLQFAPLWAFTAVAGADRSIDQKEMMALAKELAEAPLYKDALTREVLMSVGANLQSLMTAYRDDTRDVLTGLKDVADVLDRKAGPEEAQNFKQAMLLIVKNVAESSGGMFGSKFSNEEKAAAVLIAQALRLKIG